MFDDKDSLLDTWMYVLEDFGSERSALAKDKIYTHINLKQMTIIREAEAGLMDCKLDIIMSLHPLMQYIPLFILKWQGLQKKVIFVTDTTTDDKHKLRVLYADGDKELPDLCKKLWKMLDEILPNWPNLDNFSISCFVVKRASFFLPLGC
ncbi:putative monogalactosyldiacylglycerol synthase [Helianthus annuus]|uniref:Monogalactosyldiacylglycerol synthase n=1 Tax=Helianthus annuus TaxID=4232 RepID=A0A9K3IJL6_HELAN|nr:putative monogalactosyldiacylglycerol synthase [Helianthus annuus]